ncbi:MAG: hypothetical protein ACI9EF_003360 [Pseudohongiellaceae bacterium]|jgi:hypothetical protein
MRPSLLPTLAILVLLSLVFLLPKRQENIPSEAAFLLPGSAAAGADVATVLAQLPRLEMAEPPSWALSRGTDDVLRHLDRMGWGSHAAMVTARRALEQQAGSLIPEVLSRLAVLGEADSILISKLIALLGAKDTPAAYADQAIEELVRRALSESALVAKAALRVLAYHPSPAALGGILERRNDENLEVQTFARAALAQRVRQGDSAALGYVVDELELTTSSPDLAYVTALGEADIDDRARAVLREIVEQGDQNSVLTALASLLVHQDPMAFERVGNLIEHGDEASRLNGVRMAALSGQVFLTDQWEELVRQRQRPVVLPLMSMMERAVNEGHSEALLAVQLLETIALDSSHSCHQEALDVLLRQAHPMAVERTRTDLANGVGAYLNVAVDRVVHVGGELAQQYADLAVLRLQNEDLVLSERILLCRLVAHVDPAQAVDFVIAGILDDGGPGFLSLLSRLGGHGLQHLAMNLDDDREAGLFVFAAASTGAAEALPYLETIVLNTQRDRVIRMQALDCIVRLNAGPREQALRRLAIALGDAEITERARLLFWNYL